MSDAERADQAGARLAELTGKLETMRREMDALRNGNAQRNNINNANNGAINANNVPAIVPQDPIGHVNAYAPEIAPFMAKDPLLWYIRAESSLRTARITSDATKLDYLVQQLSEAALVALSGFCQSSSQERKFKKRLIPSVMEAGVGGGSQNRLFMRDLNSGRLSLQDTGADISLIPRDPKLHTKPSGFLYALNGSKVHAYGESFLMIRFPGITREFPWKFRVADVDSMIISGDFLKHYKLMVDLDGRRLVDKEIGSYGLGTCKPSPHVSIRSVDPNPVADAQVNSMLSEFRNH
ncbi:hypothetical protein QAD02_014270 [Eretmocerus hayati]|uniref:Uncharacterized protein n=1 Tax=Eretmocerus hayati TaxID=131215 RepID=A0ACC2P5W6_9HYME|nr:hypothetical protein QAD02_014270 [Eretmocerus hayati]